MILNKQINQLSN